MAASRSCDGARCPTAAGSVERDDDAVAVEERVGVGVGPAEARHQQVELRLGGHVGLLEQRTGDRATLGGGQRAGDGDRRERCRQAVRVDRQHRRVAGEHAVEPGPRQRRADEMRVDEQRAVDDGAGLVEQHVAGPRIRGHAGLEQGARPAVSAPSPAVTFQGWPLTGLVRPTGVVSAGADPPSSSLRQLVELCQLQAFERLAAVSFGAHDREHDRARQQEDEGGGQRPR